MKNTFDILLVGVGGQGVLTLFKILGETALEQDLYVIGAETHGMSQRGGSVFVHLRISKNSDNCFAPTVLEGSADLLVSLEPAEALRFVSYLKPGGTIITSINPIEPPNLAISKKKYPDLVKIKTTIKKITESVLLIDFRSILENKTGMRPLNIAMLGALTGLENFPLNGDLLLKLIEEKYPKHWKLNETAFNLGKNSVKSELIDTVKI